MEQALESLELTDNQTLVVPVQPTSSPDLLSQLPQPILHQILSHVLIDEAARTAVLSKTWFQVWNTLPFLNFGGRFATIGNIITRTNRLLPYIDRILTNRWHQCLTVHKFSCYRGFNNNGLLVFLKRWIAILGDLHIHDLCLRSCYGFKKVHIALPKTILSAKSIASLELEGFNLDSLRGNVVKWPLLRELYLMHVHASDDLIREIVTNCCGIEVLNFSNCIGFKIVTISKLVKLRKFSIQGGSRCESPKVDIDVPSLECFYYVIATTQNCININACTRLKDLRVSGRVITQDWVDKLFYLFPLLESLTLDDCKMLVKVNVSSCNLNYLCLNADNLVEINIDAPNLCTFLYYGNCALLFSLNASPMLQVKVVICRRLSVNLVECAKVTTFLTAIGCSDFVSLSFCSKDLAFPKEIRDGLNYSGCKLKNLLLYIRFRPDSEILSATLGFLDYLLLVYSELESLCIITDVDAYIASLKLLYEKLKDKEEILHCCDSLPVKCWRHLLKEVIFGAPENNEAQRYRRVLNGKDISKFKILRIKLMPR